ncbi:MAG: tetratricopeptide (TPR) repeat protein [Planctomycetota bacterium]
MKFALLILALLSLTTNIVSAQEDSVRTVHVGRIDVVATPDSEHGMLLTVKTETGRIKSLLARIAQEVGRPVTGLENISRDPVVEIYLVERPWREALRWVTGSAGLHVTVTYDAIKIKEELPAFPEADDAYMAATIAWQRVRAMLPAHENADEHELALGDCALALGPTFASTARVHYENVVNDFPQSDLRPECLLRASNLYAAAEEWNTAMLSYHELANLTVDHPYHSIARRELARSMCRIGGAEANKDLRSENARKALLTLKTLDLKYPSPDSVERRERALLQSLALTLTDDPIRALRALDIAATYSPSGHRDPGLNEVRALAFERAGSFGDAAVAWLYQTQHTTGAEQEAAFVRSAKASLKAGDELGTLAIVAHAEQAGYGDTLAPFGRTAESRLGLIGDVSTLSMDQRITRGRELLAEDAPEQAAMVLGKAFEERNKLRPEVLDAIAKDLASALSATNDWKNAVDVLRTAAADLPKNFDRSSLYRAAADVLEKAGRFEAAIDALEGRL